MNTKLKKNDKAIDFNISDYLGNTINLNNYKGKKVLITFFRGSSCPFCNLRFSLHDKKKKGIDRREF